MKLDKNNVSHIIILLLSAICICLVLMLRKFRLVRASNKTIALYGHKINGNLKYFYDYLTTEKSDYYPLFLTLDRKYVKTIKRTSSIRIYSLLSLKGMFMLARSAAIITDHGSHLIFPILRNTNLRFIDVWHGVPFKGFKEDSFNEQKKYDQVWVNSESFVEIYKQKFAFKNNVIATGYGRTDPLVNRSLSKEGLLKKYGLESKHKNIVLLAPTWKQDSNNRSIIPFGETQINFFKKLEDIGKASNSLIIFRAHINSSETSIISEREHIKVMSYKDFPEAEEFLYISDLLISDWSSIVFDFMVLGRPTVFLDVEPPFKNGFTLDETYRFGPIVSNMNQLREIVCKYIGHDKKYQADFHSRIEHAANKVYGGLDDGKSNNRYLANLEELITHKQSSI